MSERDIWLVVVTKPILVFQWYLWIGGHDKWTESCFKMSGSEDEHPKIQKYEQEKYCHDDRPTTNRNCFSI